MKPFTAFEPNTYIIPDRVIELAIMSRPALDGATAGHIMIAVAIAGLGEKAWGFYPDGIKDEIIVGGWHRYTSSTVIRLSESQYLLLLKAIEDFKEKYSLFSNNCINFVVTVLGQAHIVVPI